MVGGTLVAVIVVLVAEQFGVTIFRYGVLEASASAWWWASRACSATSPNRSSSATARRRTRRRDIPGFGGLLDVIDSRAVRRPGRTCVLVHAAREY